MSVDELLVDGYIHHTFENEFFFNIHIVSKEVHRTILMFVPKAEKMSISISLGPCIVLQQSTKKYTVYSYTLKIMNETHSFTARYSSFSQFHNALFQNKNIRHSFGDNPPTFPGKNWWKDFTKAENYNDRANKLLKYFQLLLQKQSVVTSHIFHNGVYLPKHLRDALSHSVRGYYWPTLPELSSSLLLHSPRSRSNKVNKHCHSPLFTPIYSPRYYSNKKNALQNALEDLVMKTDQSFVSVFYGDLGIPMLLADCYEFVDNIYLFDIEDVLPLHLMDRTLSEMEQNIQINMELFERMSVEENKKLDEIVLQVKNAILEAVGMCHVTLN